MNPTAPIFTPAALSGASYAQKATSSAVRVFSTQELAENIILQLYPTTILSLYRVCRTTRDAIDNSNLIQELLFFQPICKTALYCRSVGPTFLPTRERYWATQAEPLIERRIVENPFVYLVAGIYPQERDGEFFRPEASWRRMLVTQPPVESLQLYVEGNDRRKPVVVGFISLRACSQLLSPAFGAGSNQEDVPRSKEHRKEFFYGHEPSPPRYHRHLVKLNDLASAGSVEKIDGWGSWEAFKDRDQLRQVKKQAQQAEDEVIGERLQERVDEKFFELEDDDQW